MFSRTLKLVSGRLLAFRKRSRWPTGTHLFAAGFPESTQLYITWAEPAANLYIKSRDSKHPPSSQSRVRSEVLDSDGVVGVLEQRIGRSRDSGERVRHAVGGGGRLGHVLRRKG